MSNIDFAPICDICPSLIVAQNFTPSLNILCCRVNNVKVVIIFVLFFFL